MRSLPTTQRAGLLGLLILLPLCSSAAAQGMVIAEFLASNDGLLLDEDGDDSDWIELENRGEKAVDLTGWHLSDDASEPTKWTLPALTLIPGERALVFASDKDRAVAGQELHTNFKLTTSGEYLGLWQPGAVALGWEYAPAFPPQSTNISYGLRVGMLDVGFFSTPTPGQANGMLFAPIEPPTLGAAGGVLSSPTFVVLNHPDPATLLRYTTDGSAPTETTGTPFFLPITLSTTTVLRARAFLPGYEPSAVMTTTFVSPQAVLLQDAASALARGFPADWVDRSGADWSNMGRPGAWYGMFGAHLAPFHRPRTG